MKTTLQNGFTLVEMAIVLMIVGLLLSGLLVPLSAQMDQKNNAETQKALSEIKEALMGYAMANGRLPCPATPSTPTGQTANGVMAGNAVLYTTSNVCSILTGVLPWATLGVNETDAWGNRYTYRVDSVFSDLNTTTTYGSGCSPDPTPTNASFALCSTGSITVNSSAATPHVTVAGNVPAVVISHGKNSAGAWTPLGNQITRDSTKPDEYENSDTTNASYVSHTPTPAFDDLVVWISLDILFNRMVSSGKLP